ncbi:MAG: 30S ribosomal protein S16 [Patescibacteria group bacterium]
MLVIRLSRVGKKKHPTYRVVVSEKTKDTVGNYLELLGNYDPHENKAELKSDRIKHWISKGAKPSGVVHNLLIDQKIIEGEKLAVAHIKKKKGDASGGQEAAGKPAEGAQSVSAPAEQSKAEPAPAPQPEKKVEEKKTEQPAEKKE